MDFTVFTGQRGVFTRWPNATHSAVVRVRSAVRVAGLLQPLHLTGDVRPLHPQPGGQLAGARRPGLGELLQDHHGGAVQRHRGHGPDPVVAPGPGDQVADPGDRPQDLGGIRPGLGGIRGGGGGFWLGSAHVTHPTLIT